MDGSQRAQRAPSGAKAAPAAFMKAEERATGRVERSLYWVRSLKC